MKTTSTSKWLKVLIVMVATAWSLPSRADIAPTCSAYDALITCDAKDVGKACQTGGQCYAVSCGTGMTVYRCDACPAILSAPDAGCDPSKFGTACGDGGICSSTQAYCNTSSTKFVCTGPTPAKPTGPPAGESGGASGSAGTTGGSGCTGGGNASGGSGVLGGQSGAGAAACPSCKSSGGCDVAPRATGPGAIALALLAVGMLALLYDRRRKRRR
jgi:uncharacterized membrane protein YgcG